MRGAFRIRRPYTTSQHRPGIPWNGVWVLGDQSTVSAANFLTMVLLARMLQPEAFGLFVLVFTALLFLNQIQNSLITRPHNVLAAALPRGDYVGFTTATAAAQLVFSSLLLLVGLAMGLAAWLIGWSGAGLLLAFGPAAFAWQTQEFLRQAMYTKTLSGQALVCDLARYVGQASLIAALFWHGSLSGASALWVIACTSAAATFVGAWQLREDFGQPDWGALAATWRFGRWLLGDGLGNWLSGQLYPLLTAAIVGVAGIAVLKAVQNLVAPGQVVMNAFMAYAVPRAARAQMNQGSAFMKQFVLRSATGAGLLLIAYWASISALAGPALRLLYGETYGEYGALVGLTAVASIFYYVTLGQSVALLAMEQPRVIFAGRLVAILLTFSAGVPLVWWLGVYGAVIGSALSYLALSVFLANALSHEQDSPRPERRSTAVAVSTPLAGGER